MQARKAMETREEQSRRSRDALITDILNEMQVYIAGGDPIGGTLLNQKIQDAAYLCLDRLYPSSTLPISRQRTGRRPTKGPKMVPPTP